MKHVHLSKKLLIPLLLLTACIEMPKEPEEDDVLLNPNDDQTQALAGHWTGSGFTPAAPLYAVDMVIDTSGRVVSVDGNTRLAEDLTPEGYRDGLISYVDADDQRQLVLLLTEDAETADHAVGILRDQRLHVHQRADIVGSESTSIPGEWSGRMLIMTGDPPLLQTLELASAQIDATGRARLDISNACQGIVFDFFFVEDTPDGGEYWLAQGFVSRGSGPACPAVAPPKETRLLLTADGEFMGISLCAPERVVQDCRNFALGRAD